MNPHDEALVQIIAKAMVAELTAQRDKPTAFAPYVDADDLANTTLDGRFDLISVARAAIAPFRSGAEGWRLLPVKPTEAMIDEGMSHTDTYLSGDNSDRETIRTFYNAFIKASSSEA